ncbi:MAG: radical SAM protein [Nitrospirae bacterium]|nr:radical SAM protein [Nitrospirota bacterium]
MCNIWQKYKEDPHKNKEELNVQEIREAFSRSNILKKARIILITGGEPFLKRDFSDIILFFNELNPTASIIIASNGLSPDLISDKLRNIRQALVKRGNKDVVIGVGVSLDGMEETHDRVRGVKGSFKNALKTVEVIRNIEGIFTGLSFTFTPENFREFYSVRELAKEMKLGLTFQFAQTSGHYYENKDIHFNWNRKQIDEVRDILKKTRYFDVIRKGFFDYGTSQALKDRLLSYNRFFLEHVLEYQLHQERHFNCFSGTHSCFLDPYGNVYPCIPLEKKIGNICENNFDDLWTSPMVNEIREHISQRQCHCCSFCDIPNSLPRNLCVITSNLKNILMSG